MPAPKLTTEAIQGMLRDGVRVTIKLSDAEPSDARIKEIQVDEIMGNSYLVCPVGRQELWVSIHRITDVL